MAPSALPLDAPGSRAESAQAVESDRLRAAVREHFDGVGRFLRGLGVREADVDDAAQRVFEVLARRIAAISPGAERAFLYQTALRVASHERRAAARAREVLDDNPAAASELPPADDLVDQRRARECLDRILEGMPLDLRTPFVLFEIEEMLVGEIAALLELPLGTVASRLRRARQDFEQRVARWAARRRVHRGGVS
jgi:RNA polymerase sigma-70 factor (ECF subfamily)